MKSNKKITILFSFVLLIGFLNSCFEYDALNLLSPTSISNIKATTARAENSLIDLASSASQHGHCWSITPEPTINLQTKSELGIKTDKNSFQSILTNLSPSTTYYIRAYLVINAQVFYGTENNFLTETPALVVKQLFTSSPYNITINTATVEAEVSLTGNISISQHGHCWAINPSPTVTGSRTELGTKNVNGIFISNLSDLGPRQRYYLRAYIITPAGTFYSNEIEFRTVGN